jgi:hypothetical protein
MMESEQEQSAKQDALAKYKEVLLSQHGSRGRVAEQHINKKLKEYMETEEFKLVGVKPTKKESDQLYANNQ